jgi:hypothetical protein
MEPSHRHIEFLFIDRDDCGRSSGTEDHLLAALEQAREDLATRAVTTSLEAVHVADATTAVARRLVSSPTVRVNGYDIAGALVESACAADGCTCGDGTSIDCRVWEWQGRTYEVPPVAMLVERIIDPVGPRVLGDDYVLPDNLARFFSTGVEAGCCAPAVAATCCAPSDKTSCCGEDGDTCSCK